MGRTLATANQLFQEEQAALTRFRRALRREDQLVLDELFALAHRHLPAISHAAHISPFETLLLSMLIEEHKAVLELRCASYKPPDSP
jgi:hypothetical protein